GGLRPPSEPPPEPDCAGAARARSGTPIGERSPCRSCVLAPLSSRRIFLDRGPPARGVRRQVILRLYRESSPRVNASRRCVGWCRRTRREICGSMSLVSLLPPTAAETSLAALCARPAT